MERLLLVFLGVASAALGCSAESLAVPRHWAQDASPSGPLPADVLVLADGQRFEGLIESESAAWVQLAQVLRPAGRARFAVIRTFERSRIARIERLDPDARTALRHDLESLIHRARIEAGRMDELEIGTAEQSGTYFRRYRGEWFSLESTADDTTTRRIAVRVEQIFTAYRQIVPPRRQADRPLRIVVYSSLDRYREHLGRLGLSLENPSCYVQAENLVLAACEYDKYHDTLSGIDRQHAQLREELSRLETRLAERLGELGAMLQQAGQSRGDKVQFLRRERIRLERAIAEKREEIRRCDRENARAFEQVAGLMFARLYHEAFHAYLENYVYPAARYDVPVWLNEGLATVFERGQLEDDVLRFDAPNPAALQRLQADLRSGSPLALATLLADEPSAFWETGGNASEQAARRYAAAWGVVYYLIYARGLLEPLSLDPYVAMSPQPRLPVERFEQWTGEPLPEFERKWREYVMGLR